MRSYYAHLKSATGKTETKVAPRSIFRSSAIFPVMQKKEISSRILFMGYWILKRNIQQIAAIITLRDLEGNILNRENLLINEAKTYRIELSEQLSHAGLPSTEDFEGSLEIEFFSTVNLVFPFPAVVINFYGPNFSAVVHTAQRIYNDMYDMLNNSQTNVPESGFNVFADDNHEPFIGIINGPLEVPDAKIGMEFYNSDQEILTHELSLGDFAPYATRIIYPGRLLDLKGFLNGKVGAGKLSFHVNWAFPRLLVGNLQHDPAAMSITHTYYDCSAAESDSDYWREEQPGWYSAALMVPLCADNEQFTTVDFYPIYSPASFAIDVEIYNSTGKCLGLKKEALVIQAPLNQIKQIKLRDLVRTLRIRLESDLAARIIAHPIGNSRIPARIKLGLDLGEVDIPEMACNICTNLQPFNPDLENKPTAFRWTPVLADRPQASLWLMNSSTLVDYHKTAELHLTFFREQDAQTLSRDIKLLPHGFTVIRVEEDRELRAFFDGKVGWCTITANNPYIVSYYFTHNPSGIVGGDHGF